MPAIHASDLQDVYKEVAGGYQRLHSADLDKTTLDEYISLVPPNAKILDLGAGNGRDSGYFSEHGADVTMVDISAEMLDYAQENAPNAKRIVADMTELSFPSGEFDGIWANASLLHLTKDECFGVLRALHLMLKKNGVLFVRVKKGEGEKEIEEGKYGKPMRRFFSFYEQRELERVLQESGFEILDSKIVGEIPTKQWVRVFSRAK